ncbi:hypothetical protein QEH53_08690 [Pelagicoccus sp. SDUM812002]|nr:hypothetical protein [Pelagicoccus sp. SDUM812002]
MHLGFFEVVLETERFFCFRIDDEHVVEDVVVLVLQNGVDVAIGSTVESISGETVVTVSTNENDELICVPVEEDADGVSVYIDGLPISIRT